MPAIDFPEIPEFCRIPQIDRREAWIGREVRPTFAGTIVIGRTVVRDAGTERVRLEMEAALADKRERELAKKRDDEAVRKRGLKNQRIIALAIAGEVTLPKPPVKIVRVVDLTPPAVPAATEETDLKKAAAKKPAKNPKPGRRPVSAGPAPKALRRPKVDIVQTVANMMAAKGGASMAEMVKATGVDAHQMRAKIKLVRDRLKYTTTAPSKANGNRYSAVPPKKAEG